MKRRDFLKASAGVAAGIAIPGFDLSSRPDETAVAIFEFGSRMRVVTLVPSEYFCFMHPAAIDSLRRSEERGRWTAAWRAYRLARRKNVCRYLRPHEVLARFGPPSLMPRGQIGRLGGFRIIETARVA